MIVWFTFSGRKNPPLEAPPLIMGDNGEIFFFFCFRKERHCEVQSHAQHRLGAIRPKPGPTFLSIATKSRQKMHSAPGTLAQYPFTIKKRPPGKLAALKQFRA
jgi:hypothetical protein